MSVSIHGATDYVPNIIFGWDPMITATVVMLMAYAFITTERINRAIIALLGAGLMIFLGVMNQDLAIRGIDFNTIFLLIGMMAIVSITGRTGVFQYVATFAAKSVKANPRALLAVLAIITAFFSAILDNVTTVMLVVPITLLLTDQLKLNPYPFLFSQIFASNIGGMATLIGDPPNILIGSAVGLSFIDFVENVGPASLVLMIVMTGLFDVIWGRRMKVAAKDQAIIMKYQPREAITDFPLLMKCLFTLTLVIGGFIFGHDHGFEPGTIALTGAAFLMLLECYEYSAEEQSHKVHRVFKDIEWETIFFFIGLFIIVYGVETAGLLQLMGKELLEFTAGDIAMTGYIVLWSSAILSAVVDNIPFVATMIPLIESTQGAFGGKEQISSLWWALSLGACLGGNGSLIGASANVMVASFAERAGHRISFMKFLALGFPLMLLTIVIAHVYFMLVFVK
jgi:Na+/H+ antiporter NhaD/arsenite permease-like protein